MRGLSSATSWTQFRQSSFGFSWSKSALSCTFVRSCVRVVVVVVVVGSGGGGVLWCSVVVFCGGCSCEQCVTHLLKHSPLRARFPHSLKAQFTRYLVCVMCVVHHHAPAHAANTKCQQQLLPTTYEKVCEDRSRLLPQPGKAEQSGQRAEPARRDCHLCQRLYRFGKFFNRACVHPPTTARVAW